MESYVVRIYRRAKNNSENILGIVEQADSGANTTFKSFEELHGIFFPKETSLEAAKQKQIVEQRKFRRFLIKEGTLIFNATTDVGKIEDISMGGLSFSGPKILEDTILPQEICILCDRKKWFAEDIQCRKIIPHDFPFNMGFSDKSKSRMYSIEFGALTIGQHSQLQDIIENHTLDEV